MYGAERVVCIDKLRSNEVSGHRPDRDQAVSFNFGPDGFTYTVHVVDVVSQLALLDIDESSALLSKAQGKVVSRFGPYGCDPLLPHELIGGFHAELEKPALSIQRKVGWTNLHRYESPGIHFGKVTGVKYCDYTHGENEGNSGTKIGEISANTPGDTEDLSECPDIFLILAEHLWCNYLANHSSAQNGYATNAVIHAIPLLANNEEFRRLIFGGNFVHFYFKEENLPSQMRSNPDHRLLTPWDTLQLVLSNMKAHSLNKMLMDSVGKEFVAECRLRNIPLLYTNSKGRVSLLDSNSSFPNVGYAGLTHPMREWGGVMNQLNLTYYLITNQLLLGEEDLMDLLEMSGKERVGVYKDVMSDVRQVIGQSG